MNMIQVKNAGVKFFLCNQKRNTLLETIVRLMPGKSTESSSEQLEDEDFWALRHVSFSVQEGESIGIIGRNGAGKSTLLQLLTGIYKPDEGEVKVEGSIGLLQLGAGFHPDLTGRDNIYLSGATLGLKRKEIAGLYDAIVEFSELKKFINTPIKNYSSGMISRLGFSIAINIEPDILLIDEVLSVGDASFKKKSRKKLEEMRGRNKTIVFVSHSLNDVKNSCDRAICLDHGQIVFEGSSADAVSFYDKNYSN